jgi:hypothetical protein
MPVALFVPGPTVIEVNITGSFVVLGYSDNDNLPSMQASDNHHEIKTVLSGAVPEEIVLTGTAARISLALVKWDQTVLEALLAKQRGASNIATVGRRLVSGNATFKLRVRSVSGTAAYEFGRCYLQQDGHGDSQWGNRERVCTLNISAIPDAENELYTYTP